MNWFINNYFLFYLPAVNFLLGCLEKHVEHNPNIKNDIAEYFDMALLNDVKEAFNELKRQHQNELKNVTQKKQP
jgi:hypothetical protein